MPEGVILVFLVFFVSLVNFMVVCYLIAGCLCWWDLFDFDDFVGFGDFAVIFVGFGDFAGLDSFVIFFCLRITMLLVCLGCRLCVSCGVDIIPENIVFSAFEYFVVSLTFTVVLLFGCVLVLLVFC